MVLHYKFRTHAKLSALLFLGGPSALSSALSEMSSLPFMDVGDVGSSYGFLHGLLRLRRLPQNAHEVVKWGRP
jgi:hypothetical protein